MLEAQLFLRPQLLPHAKMTTFKMYVGLHAECYFGETLPKAGMCRRNLVKYLECELSRKSVQWESRGRISGRN